MSRLLPALTAIAAAAAAFAAHALPGETGVGPVPSPPETVGPHPVIKPVDKHLIPTMQIAVAKGWPAGAKPTAPAGVAVAAFATGLNHPRWLYVLPNGDVLVAETNAPPKPDDAKGIKGKVMKSVQKKAGAGAPTANRIPACPRTCPACCRTVSRYATTPPRRSTNCATSPRRRA